MRPYVLHCGWCGHAMHEACKCAERLVMLVELGITDDASLEAILAQDEPAEPEKVETWRDREPML